MVFTRRLRDGVRRGEITCSVRIWMSPRVRAGARYPMEEGQIEIDSIRPIGFPDITPQLARESGFLGIVDLLKVAKHGKGENIYLVRFHYLPPRGKRRQDERAPAPSATRAKDASGSSPRRRQK
ncbi:MAG TPA: ASCH domain-containing protein [Bryobacteraceae bacterium]